MRWFNYKYPNKITGITPNENTEESPLGDAVSRQGVYKMTPLDLLEVAHAYAARSKDPSTKLAALIIDDNMAVRSSGWNGFARGVRDTPERLNDRPTRLAFTVHGEANAIANAARIGVSTDGCVLLVTQLHPCAECSKLIVQAGIKKVYAPLPQDIDSRWAASFETAALIFKEAGVTVEFY